MLVKEYRISLPMSIDEYRIAQLYMIQRKSREESSGTESGVEILINRPYEDGPGGSGQYTHKVYHVGGHLPGWFRAILPKSALQVEEEAWNAYPYTKTIYRCPFIQKFVLEIETRYFNDAGDQDNVFNLNPADMHSRVVDYLDIVQDPLSGADYKPEEDPTLFHSTTTNRGPLSATWHSDYARASRLSPTGDTRIMCAYKLCKVEFRYWGMQSKIERFIHDIGLRKTMLRAHRQAWCWQDEYYGLTMADIRRLEHDTQIALQQKMNAGGDGGDDVAAPADDADTPTENYQGAPLVDGSRRKSAAALRAHHDSPVHKTCVRISAAKRKESWASAASSFTGSDRTVCNWNVDGLELLGTSTSDDDEFFDAHEDVLAVEKDGHKNVCLIKTSSLEMLTPDDEYVDTFLNESSVSDQISTGAAGEPWSPLDRRLEHYRSVQLRGTGGGALAMQHATLAPQSCNTTILFLVLHGGSIMDSGEDVIVKQSDVTTLRSTLASVMQAHYPTMSEHIAVRAVPCPAVCSDTLSLLASLSPTSYEGGGGSKQDASPLLSDHFPLSAVPLFAATAPDYLDAVTRTVASSNRIYSEFLRSNEGAGFSGQVCVIGDSVGSLLAYDALCRPRPGGGGCSRCSSMSEPPEPTPPPPPLPSHEPSPVPTGRGDMPHPDVTVSGEEGGVCRQGTSCPGSRRTSTGSQDGGGRFDFDVSDFFMFGAPLGLLLAYRRRLAATAAERSHIPKPSCLQLYNLFYVSDPSAIRVEPLLSDRFSQLRPVAVPRYSKFPLGDGLPLHVVETLQANADMFTEQPSLDEMYVAEDRRSSMISMQSDASGHGELTTANIAAITTRWWGNKRLDYAIYCPEALQAFPNTALPYLLHASFWESMDAASFILRQVVRQEYTMTQTENQKEALPFSPSQPREKWLKRRTTIKLRNVAPNHRANDVILAEGKPQTLVARFMYGPLDMVSLSAEKIDVHIMTRPPDGEWIYFGTEVTDSNGRATFTIPEARRLGHGLYPIKMVVRGDHTCVDFYLTVVLPKAETVVFSIDGAFAASVSIMGKDPKVQPGAVDVVRHWQDLGYLLLYVTARPDMQHKRVVTWLAQHNFPHGVVAFMDGLCADPLRQKANYLKQLMQEADIQFCAGYGSSKDIWVYQSINLEPKNTYIVGKVSKKHQKEAVALTSGYAAHLAEMVESGRCRPAATNALMHLRKTCFSLPGLKRRRATVRKTTSLPPPAHNGEEPVVTYHSTSIKVTDVNGDQLRRRGVSPRGRLP